MVIKVRDSGERTHARNPNLSRAHLTGDRPSPVVGLSLIEGIQISALDGPPISGQAAHKRRGAADRGEYRQGAGVVGSKRLFLGGLTAPAAGVASVGQDVVFNAHLVL